MIRTPIVTESPDVRASAYIGRFLHRFAILESTINEMFGQLLGLNYGSEEGAARKAHAHLVLIANVDLRKKLLFIEHLLNVVNLEGHELLGQMHKFHDIRNIIAHYPFCDDVFPDADGVLVQGISFDYVNKKGDVPDQFYTYAKLETIDVQMSEFWDKLEILLGRVTEVTVPELAVAEAVKRAMVTFDNIVRFPDGK